MDQIECSELWNTEKFIYEKYQSYKSFLFRIAFSYVGNKQDSEDILQEAFIKLCYYAPDFSSAEDEKRWIIRVTINLCKNHLRSFWYKNKVNIDNLESFAYEPKTEEVILDLLRLPVKYKSVIQLYYFVGYKVSEIAEILNLSESGVKMRLKRGRELLKIELEDAK
ncbi:sigma-70 family RNA polymerase sigma factor [Mobilitalea sibirica]|uniref:Sigma-70 family RNA polymerase sigma factor n=1 Tax=Mobilitalea sibirica TaxID=1462919 RepID=A0A8J7H1I9_9FIRM|nr:sigma-70 family RNA polymerase sigma factor [Mobilitalea sibirica]MBH1940273.1 sigma-70 family RNA polymerase sigma factor [Mobilitalea sibirica]